MLISLCYPLGMLVANDYLLMLVLNNPFIYSYIKFVQRLMTILHICRMRLIALNLLHKLNNLQLIWKLLQLLMLKMLQLKMFQLQVM